MAALASPALLPTKACSALRPSLRNSAIVALETLALGPSSQTIGRASSAVLACHQVSATTATAESPTGTTFLTPFMPRTLAWSKLFTLPPNTGQSLIAALSMPGSLTSIPYIILPVVLSTVSSRFSGLPAIFQSFGSLSLMSLGTSSLAAASATLPNVVLRPEGVCVITPFDAVHSDVGTFHSLAAAWISMVRAAAPPLRTYSCEVRIPRLPPVDMSPHTRLRATLWPGVGYSVVTFDQSHSSSSATSWARPVSVP